MIASLVLAAFQVAASPAATAAPAVTVPAATSAVPAAAVKTASTNPDDKIVCEYEDSVGTRLGGHKVCMTRGQRRELERQQRDAVRHAQDQKGYVHN